MRKKDVKDRTIGSIILMGFMKEIGLKGLKLA